MTDKSITSGVCRISEKYRPVCEVSVGTEEHNTAICTTVCTYEPAV